MSSSWRAVGITYLQYLEMSSAAVRNCLKQPLRDQVQARSAVHFRHRTYQNGKLLRSRFIETFENSPVSIKKAAE